MGGPNLKCRLMQKKYVKVIQKEEGQSRWRGVLVHDKKNFTYILADLEAVEKVSDQFYKDRLLRSWT